MLEAGVEYTFETYERFLESFLDAGYEFQGFDPEVAEKAVIVRHDVDLSVDRAVRMARLEADLGVRSTYCFLLTSPAYDLLDHAEDLAEIESLGHEVALHFDTHHYWDHRPGTETVESAVATELETLERLVDSPVEVVSFHMPPEWVLGRAFEGFTNAYHPRFFGDIDYVSDSAQKWRAEPVFDGPAPDRVQILVHPGAWTEDDRPIADIVGDLADEKRRRVDAYLEPFQVT